MALAPQAQIVPTVYASSPSVGCTAPVHADIVAGPAPEVQQCTVGHVSATLVLHIALATSACCGAS